MGGEILAPLFCFGLCLALCHQVLIQKRIPPLWFFAGGAGLFIGWVLLVYLFSKGGSVFQGSGNVYDSRNFKNWQFVSWKPILENFLSRIQQIMVYPFLIYIVLSLISKRASRQSFFQKRAESAFFSIGFLGLVISSFTPIPKRSYIVFTVFFVISASISFWEILHTEEIPTKKDITLLSGLIFLLILQLSPWEPYIRTLTSLGFIGYFSAAILINGRIFHRVLRRIFIPLFCVIFMFNLLAYTTYYKVCKGYFQEIKDQKGRGVKKIIIPASSTGAWHEIIPMNYHFIRNGDVVLTPMALYYNVERIDFVDPITMKSYRGRFD